MSSTPPVPPDPSQPVMTVEWWKSAVVALLLAVTSVLVSFGVWEPTNAQIAALTAAGATIVAIVFLLIAFFVHNRVTPTKDLAVRLAALSPTPPLPPPE